MQMMLGGTHNKQMHTKGTRAHLVMNARISEALLFLSDNKGGGGGTRKDCCSTGTGGLEFETVERCIVWV